MHLRLIRLPAISTPTVYGWAAPSFDLIIRQSRSDPAEVKRSKEREQLKLRCSAAIEAESSDWHDLALPGTGNECSEKGIEVNEYFINTWSGTFESSNLRRKSRAMV
jgi:hypothetical protein